jgi:long-chain acyl-CoA synthetase
MVETYFYAKKKHVKNRLLQFLARKNNIIVMDITNDLKESIQKLAEVLRQGKKIIIFPEGTRTKDGNLGDFKKMFSILSKEMNVPIIPVSIQGAYHALPRGKKIPKLFAKVNVEFLKPVYPANYNYDSLTEIVKSEIDNASKS